MGADDEITGATPDSSASAEAEGKAVQPDQPTAAAGPDSSSQDTPPAADAPSTHEFGKTLLDGAEKAPDEKPEAEAKPAEEKPEVKAEEAKPEAKEPEKTEDAEKKAEEAEKPAEEAEEPEAAPLDPIDWFAEETGLKLPETIKLDDATKGELTAALEEFRTAPVKGAQALLDLHAKALGEMQQHTSDEQWRVFRETNDEWAKQVMADPVLGGARHDTAMKRVAAARDLLASTAKPGTEQHAKDVAAFNEMARITGVGNHPVFLRMLHNASRYVREAEMPPPNGKPPKDNGKDPSRAGKALTYENTDYTK